ncbi:MAG: hypothetical protein ABFS32_06630 [Bacteroidota bacterium]
MGLSIGIGGVSRAGKTTLSNYIRDLYSDKKTIAIPMDEYVLDKNKIPRIKDRIDWETPASIDYELLKKDIEKAVREYDIVITEGILIFYNEEVNRLFNKRIFMDIPKSLFYKRRHSDKRWGKEPKWYIDYVWESYLKYGQLNEAFDDTLFIKGLGDFSDKKIEEYLSK